MTGPTLAARRLPRGTVTFLLTDIEGSTFSWQRNQVGMRQAIERHDEILHGEIASHAGTVLTDRGEGDSFFAVFERATDAVSAAHSIQTALRAEAWPTEVLLAVRMAIHTGEATGDYRGTVVNRCARLRSLARGGQVMLSATVRELVVDALPHGVTIKDRGTHRLRGLDRRERVFQLFGPACPRRRRDGSAWAVRRLPERQRLVVPAAALIVAGAVLIDLVASRQRPATQPS